MFLDNSIIFKGPGAFNNNCLMKLQVVHCVGFYDLTETESIIHYYNSLFKVYII